LEKALKARNQWEIGEYSPGTLSCSVSGLMAKWTLLMIDIFSSERDTDVDTTVIFDWLDARENGKTMKHDPFRVQGYAMSECMTHLIEYLPRHIACYLKFKCTNVVTILLSQNTVS